jgi:phage replication-related protein YjqB (UPF0714/DUF867 family)
MFAELLGSTGVTEVCELRSPFGFMAFHGGSLERETDTVATMAAAAAGASVYAVLQPPDLRWHIPSQLVDPAASPALAAFLDHVDVVVAVHGYGREGWWTSLLLGGGNRQLAQHLAVALRRELPHYTVVDDLDAVPLELRGSHPANPVNLPRAGGVQLELPPRVRGLGPRWIGAPKPVPDTTALVAALAAVAREWDGVSGSGAASGSSA